jgi:hypothetical protein
VGHQRSLFDQKTRKVDLSVKDERPLPSGFDFNGSGDSTPLVQPEPTVVDQPNPELEVLVTSSSAAETFSYYGSSSPRYSAPVRETSAAAYKALVEDGALGRMQRRVYAVLYDAGPMTANEINRACLQEGEVAPSYHKRLSELERLGVVRRVGIRKCNVSGNDCDAWDVTSSLPTARKPNIQRTHTIYAVGLTPRAAMDAFVSAVGWVPAAESITDLEVPPRGLSWGITFRDTATNDEVTVAGGEVPGGFTLTYFR